MGVNFYQMNNEILKLNPYNKKDIEYIQFNNYLCRKENIQRTRNELDRGLFKFSYTSAIEDTGLSRSKIQRLIKWFEEKQIIECISKSNVKGKESIYAYTSVYYYEKNNTNFNTNSDTDLSSNFNRLRVISNTNSNTNINTSKKEKRKRENKKAPTFAEVEANKRRKYTQACDIG